MALYQLEPGSFVACVFTSLQMSQDTPCGRVVPHKRVYLHTSFKLLAAGPRTLSKFIFVSTQFYLRHSYSAVPNPQPPCLAVSNRPSYSYVYLSTFCYILEFLTLPTRLSVYFILPSLIPLWLFTVHTSIHFVSWALPLISGQGCDHLTHLFSP